ncbi:MULTISPECIES: hypothetical protein [unclassified Paenibacillus]|uniref:hypothetical protein n=1 Tax=unclassified Paenibacillus TaxID=185978 RepID=UPI0012DD7726|nr:hypothetical protein [Paenibacillus sp. FSL R7-277]
MKIEKQQRSMMNIANPRRDLAMRNIFCDKYTVFKIFLLRDGNGNDNIEGDMD